MRNNKIMEILIRKEEYAADREPVSYDPDYDETVCYYDGQRSMISDVIDDLNELEIVPYSGYGITDLTGYMSEENIDKLKENIEGSNFFKLAKGAIHGWTLYTYMTTIDSNPELNEEEIYEEFYYEIKTLLNKESEITEPYDLELEIFNDYYIKNI